MLFTKTNNPFMWHGNRHEESPKTRKPGWMLPKMSTFSKSKCLTIEPIIFNVIFGPSGVCAQPLRVARELWSKLIFLTFLIFGLICGFFRSHFKDCCFDPKCLWTRFAGLHLFSFPRGKLLFWMEIILAICCFCFISNRPLNFDRFVPLPTLFKRSKCR